ncbi:unnamed protein product [Paramecium pentaurelia]|uniref:Uncharacterized protein n=1 Tax=Paramecium pentaurelia TaxID=43138 RepID=A0A8S1UM16_9CILI|nr:unnamed protein product [Paramecium pentaurelia]
MLTDLQTLARFLLQMTNSPPNYDKLQNNRKKYQIQLNQIFLLLLTRNCLKCKQEKIIQNYKWQLETQIGIKSYLVSNQSLLKSLSRNLNNFYSINCRQQFNTQNDTQLRIFDTTYNKYQHFQVTFRIQFILRRFVLLRLLENNQYLWAQKSNQLFEILMIYLFQPKQSFQKHSIRQLSYSIQ